MAVRDVRAGRSTTDNAIAVVGGAYQDQLSILRTQVNQISDLYGNTNIGNVSTRQNLESLRIYTRNTTIMTELEALMEKPNCSVCFAGSSRNKDRGGMELPCIGLDKWQNKNLATSYWSNRFS